MSGDNMSEHEKQRLATEFKNKGNAAFTGENFHEAIKNFSEAIRLTPDNHVLYSNRSAAFLSMKMAQAALKDAEECVALKPDWAKGFSRLGAAKFACGDVMGAIESYTMGLNLDSNNEGLKQGITMAKAAQEAMKSAKKEKKDAEGEDAKPTLEVKKEEKKAEAPAPENPHLGSAIIGIDLGTTFSCVGVWQPGKDQVDIIPNAHGNRTTPSYVAFTDKDRLIGEAAKNQAAANTANTLYDVKRVIGRPFSDQQVQSDIKRMPYKIVKGEADKPSIEVEYCGEQKSFQPEEISAMVLTRMKETAESFLGHKVSKAVITVPAYFNDQQRQATKDAGAIAGLEVMRIINEPTAAALAYGLDSSKSDTEGGMKVLIFDLGGGTFDVSLLNISDGIFEVLATSGDTHLGGEDFDNNIVDHAVIEFQKKHPDFDPRSPANHRPMRRLQTAAEKAKRTLSGQAIADIEIESFYKGEDFYLRITRAKFEQLNNNIFERCFDSVKKVMKDAKLEEKDIDEVVLVGGSTRIPKIQDMLKEKFKKELCRSVNPDEAVAYGAAVQGAVLSGVRHAATSQLLLLDVTPLSLGIETEGRIMSTIIKRNTAVPCSKTQEYTTVKDQQRDIDVTIFEGERQMVDGNNKLGEFVISGIQRAKKGVPKIDVTFDIDANGILHVTAKDKVTGASNNIVIQNEKGRLSNDDVERMVAEAERMKAQDAKRIEDHEAKNELEQVLSQAFESIEGHKNRKVAKKIRDHLESVRTWLDDHPEDEKAEYEAKVSSITALFEVV